MLCLIIHVFSTATTLSLQPSPGAPGRLTPVGCSPGSGPLGERCPTSWRGCRGSWGCCQWSGWAGGRVCRCPGPAGGGTPAGAGVPAEARAETGAGVALWSPAGSWILKEKERKRESDMNYVKIKVKLKCPSCSYMHLHIFFSRLIWRK